MSPPQATESKPAIIEHLQGLLRRKDRGAMAALRKGLVDPTGNVPDMAPHVEPFVPDDASPRYREACWMVAALFGSYPDAPAAGNVGDTFRQISAGSSSESIEHRFVALLKCHREDLFDHLRHAVALASSNTAGVNYEQLLKDIPNWDHEDGFVQRNWAKSYWSNQQNTTKGDDESAPATNGE
jgi:CRISPR system Cascade subunit CasB